MADRKRLALRSHDNGRFTVELDGQQITFVSRIELALDVNGETVAQLTVPAALLDIEVDVAAFVTAHAEPNAASEDGDHDNTHRVVPRPRYLQGTDG